MSSSHQYESLIGATNGGGKMIDDRTGKRKRRAPPTHRQQRSCGCCTVVCIFVLLLILLLCATLVGMHYIGKQKNGNNGWLNGLRGSHHDGDDVEAPTTHDQEPLDFNKLPEQQVAAADNPEEDEPTAERPNEGVPKAHSIEDEPTAEEPNEGVPKAAAQTPKDETKVDPQSSEPKLDNATNGDQNSFGEPESDQSDSSELSPISGGPPFGSDGERAADTQPPETPAETTDGGGDEEESGGQTDPPSEQLSDEDVEAQPEVIPTEEQTAKQEDSQEKTDEGLGKNETNIQNAIPTEETLAGQDVSEKQPKEPSPGELVDETKQEQGPSVEQIDQEVSSEAQPEGIVVDEISNTGSAEPKAEESPDEVPKTPEDSSKVQVDPIQHAVEELADENLDAKTIMTQSEEQEGQQDHANTAPKTTSSNEDNASEVAHHDAQTDESPSEEQERTNQEPSLTKEDSTPAPPAVPSTTAEGVPDVETKNNGTTVPPAEPPVDDAVPPAETHADLNNEPPGETGKKDQPMNDPSEPQSAHPESTQSDAAEDDAAPDAGNETDESEVPNPASDQAAKNAGEQVNTVEKPATEEPIDNIGQSGAGNRP